MTSYSRRHYYEGTVLVHFKAEIPLQLDCDGLELEDFSNRPKVEVNPPVVEYFDTGCKFVVVPYFVSMQRTDNISEKRDNEKEYMVLTIGK